MLQYNDSDFSDGSGVALRGLLSWGAVRFGVVWCVVCGGGESEIK